MAKHYLDTTGLTYFWNKIKTYTNNLLSNKQNIITDLDVIRNGAQKGATAIQTETDPIFKKSVAFTITENDITNWNNKPNSNIVVQKNQIGVANGIAQLDSSGKVPSSQLPSYVDDVIEVYARSGQTPLSKDWFSVNSPSSTAIIPESGKIYLLMNDTENYAINTQFRWASTTYQKINDGGVGSITNEEIDNIMI